MWRHSKVEAGHGTAVTRQNIPDDVLAAYGWLKAETKIEQVQPGFSGACVWKITVENRSYALKRWPQGQPAYLPLETIHGLMNVAVQSGLNYIPRVQVTSRGKSSVLQDGLLWDACTWQPGLHDNAPGDARLKQAVEMLSQLHSIWRSSQPQRVDVCPAVLLQHQRLTAWTHSELDQLKQQTTTGHYRQAVELFEKHRLHAIKRLAPWLTVRYTLQPCLGDVWSEHILFQNDQITGLIDFGGMRFDHPAQDLARLIGSYTQGNGARRLFALSNYQLNMPDVEKLTMLLDDCGTIVGLGNWLRWLIIDKRQMADPARAEARLQLLVDRLFQGKNSDLWQCE